MFRDNKSKINIKLKKDHEEKSTKITGIEIHSNHWGGNMPLSMKGIAVEYVTNSVDIGRNEKNQNLIHI